jgi:hypothetical protein
MAFETPRAAASQARSLSLLPPGWPAPEPGLDAVAVREDRLCPSGRAGLRHADTILTIRAEPSASARRPGVLRRARRAVGTAINETTSL